MSDFELGILIGTACGTVIGGCVVIALEWTYSRRQRRMGYIDPWTMSKAPTPVIVSRNWPTNTLLTPNDINDDGFDTTPRYPS